MIGEQEIDGSVHFMNENILRKLALEPADFCLVSLVSVVSLVSLGLVWLSDFMTETSLATHFTPWSEQNCIKIFQQEENFFLKFVRFNKKQCNLQ